MATVRVTAAAPIEIHSTVISGGRGRSAYQTWLDIGYSGTEEDFFNYLKQSPNATLALEYNEANLISRVVKTIEGQIKETFFDYSFNEFGELSQIIKTENGVTKSKTLTWLNSQLTNISEWMLVGG